MAVVDVSGEFLNADISQHKFILLNIEGEFVDIMCKVNLEPKKHLYVKCIIPTTY